MNKRRKETWHKMHPNNVKTNDSKFLELYKCAVKILNIA